MTDPAVITTQLNRMFRAVEYVLNLEGQDLMLVVEMSQAMLSDITEHGGLRPLAEYIGYYCDVIDSEGDVARIAGEI